MWRRASKHPEEYNLVQDLQSHSLSKERMLHLVIQESDDIPHILLLSEYQHIHQCTLFRIECMYPLTNRSTIKQHWVEPKKDTEGSHEGNPKTIPHRILNIHDSSPLSWTRTSVRKYYSTHLFSSIFFSHHMSPTFSYASCSFFTAMG